MTSLPVVGALQQERSTQYSPALPDVLDQGSCSIASAPCTNQANAGSTSDDTGPVARLFPGLTAKKLKNLTIVPSDCATSPTTVTIAVVLSGGPAAGGHNVISGLYSYLKARNAESRLLGFIGGPKGVMTGNHLEITDRMIARYHNLGGFDIITTGRDKIESESQFQSAKATCEKLQLDGLVVIGGDDSNTNAAMLAEYFDTHGCRTSVIGVPKTIDGDLKNSQVEVSFGFDTATKTYAELIGNIMSDARSSKKYYHFIRLMGRSASHITLECALATHPNAALIGEEVAYKRKTLSQITNMLADIIERREALGFQFGVFLVPEGLIEFIPEVGMLIEELNDLLASGVAHEQLRDKLSHPSRRLMDFLPKGIREQLTLERDPHGNVQVSKIETEKLLITLIQTELSKRKSFKGPFNAMGHFFGYEGRCALPSNFDCNYCYALGRTAGILLEHNATGMMAVVRNLAQPSASWVPGGVPLPSMMHLERRKGKLKPVIRKALVDINGQPFLVYQKHREAWSVTNSYINPGPIQFYGPHADEVGNTLRLEHGFGYDDRADTLSSTKVPARL